jgi:serine/threonine protein kinase
VRLRLLERPVQRALEADARQLDRFELIAELATGGMATVYLGRVSGAGGFQRFVVIKRLHRHLAREPEFIQMFLDEARLGARLHHPNVVPVLEIGESEGGHYLVMEYVEGSTLARLVEPPGAVRHAVPAPVAGRIMVDLLTGLHAAHALADDAGRPLRIVHRDVSPQNVLVGVDGISRLTDFGVARATSKLSTTQSGQLKGKLAYMAPEQARAAGDIDHRADIFAASVVMWEALTGERLFQGDENSDTFSKVLTKPIPLLGTTLPGLPAPFEGVLARALARDREERYPTAAVFADEIERIARRAGLVATHGDVARYLQSVLGKEVNAQRDAVRSWMASDPSRPRTISTPPPSGMVRSSSTVSGVGPRIARSDRTPSHGAPIGARTVASAGAGRRGDSIASGVGALKLRPSHVWRWIAGFAILVAAAPAWLHPSRSGSSGLRAAGAAAEARPSPPTTNGSAPAASPAAAPVPSSSRASASAPAAPPKPPAEPEPARPVPGPRFPAIASSRATGGTGSAPVPDDIARNPYR